MIESYRSYHIRPAIGCLKWLKQWDTNADRHIMEVGEWTPQALRRHSRTLDQTLCEGSQVLPETGTFSVSLEPRDVVHLVGEARRWFQSAGGRNNLRIDIPPDGGGQETYRLGPGQSASKAARYSHESSVIGVTAVRVGLPVADHGVDASTERLPHLFRKFSRLEGEKLRRDFVGSGLGQALQWDSGDRRGRIWAEIDGPGLGPVVVEAAARPSPPRRRGQAGRGPTRILAVDDATRRRSDTSETLSLRQATRRL